MSAVVTTFLLVVHLRFTSFCGRNDTGTLDEGVGKGGLSVIDVSDDTLRYSLVLLLIRSKVGWSHTMLRMLAVASQHQCVSNIAVSLLTWLLHQNVDLVHGEVDHDGQVRMVDVLDLSRALP